MIDPNSKENCTECGKRLGENTVECTTCLQYNNWTRLLLSPFPMSGISNEQNQKTAAANVQIFLEKFENMKDPEVRFRFVKRLEALAAGAMVAYHNSIVKHKIPNISAAEKAENFSEAVKQQRNEQRPKKEKKLLSAREKAIEQLTKLGISEADAARKVDFEMSSVGRNVG